MLAMYFVFHTYTFNNAAFNFSLGMTVLKMERNQATILFLKGKSNRFTLRSNIYKSAYSFISFRYNSLSIDIKLH